MRRSRQLFVIAANGDKQEPDAQVIRLVFSIIMQMLQYELQGKVGASEHFAGLALQLAAVCSPTHAPAHQPGAIAFSCHVSLLACEAYVKASAVARSTEIQGSSVYARGVSDRALYTGVPSVQAR